MWVDFCPICGAGVDSTFKLVAGHPAQHRCKEKTLNGINAAHQRDDEPYSTSLHQTQEERYKDGFSLFGSKKENKM